ncbi:hypothetical protein FKM82_021993 [Ascaphus truei]
MEKLGIYCVCWSFQGQVTLLDYCMLLVSLCATPGHYYSCFSHMVCLGNRTTEDLMMLVACNVRFAHTKHITVNTVDFLAPF